MSTSNITSSDAFIASRRDFLKTAAVAAGSFIIGTYISFPGAANAQSGAPPVYDPNVFIKIGADNTLTVLSKHFEMGQGVTTGLATMVAEELKADWSTVRFEFAASDARLYNNLLFGPLMGTGGSSSMNESWDQMRRVGAAARMMFIAAAAAKWNVPASDIVVQKSIVMHSASGRKATLGELASDAMRMPVPKEVTLKDPKDWDLIGTKVPRLDSPGKTHRQSSFRARYSPAGDAYRRAEASRPVRRESGFIRRHRNEKNRWCCRCRTDLFGGSSAREGYLVGDSRPRCSQSYVGRVRRRNSLNRRNF